MFDYAHGAGQRPGSVLATGRLARRADGTLVATPLVLPAPRMRRQVPALARGREVSIVDIESALGSPTLTVDSVRAFRAAYTEVVRPAPDSHAIVAASSSAGAFAVKAGWPEARMDWRPGRDGADLALLEIIETEHLADRFERFIVATGDGAFTTVVEGLRQQGRTVTVVARRDGLSRSLRLAASDVVYLPFTSGGNYGPA